MQPMVSITVRAIDIVGDPSFISEPLYYEPKSETNLTFNKYKCNKAVSITGAPTGMVELSKQKKPGGYNGISMLSKTALIYYSLNTLMEAGPWNTDNKCANRTLWINDDKIAPVIMPQRGTNEWSNLGETNRIKIDLNKGQHQFKLTFEPENENMNVDTNTALLGEMKLIRL